jgi:signal transduction histidine kinase
VRPARTFVDPARIEQVLGNLVSNAVKYGDPHTDIEIDLTSRGGEFEVAVTNRGRGIPADERSDLFQRFRRSQAASGVAGLGLGLYICRGLVEAHGGRIRVESTPGRTTTFFFTIPKASLATSA